MMIQPNANPLSPYNRIALSNGFELIHKEARTAPIVAIDIWIQTGAVNDPEPHYGLSHFFEHMFFKGTKRHGVGEMDRIITSLGGYNNAATSLDYTHYYVVLPSMGWKAALDVMMDSLMNPLFDPKEIDRERQVINEEIIRHEDNPWSKIYDEFTTGAFQKCRYNRKVLGTVESLAGIDHDVFAAYHRSRYSGGNVSICMVGDVGLDEAQAELSRIVEQDGRPPALPDEAPDFEMNDSPVEVLLNRDVNQAYVLLGYPTPRLTGELGEYALDTLSTLLGDGRSSRLHRRLNDELGLVSSIGCSYWSLANAGLFIIEAVTDPSKAGQVQAEIDSELAKVRGGLTEDEMSKVKSMARADFAFSNEKVISVAHTYGYGKVVRDIEHAVHYVERLEETSLDDVLSAFDAHITPTRRCRGLLLPN